ncbi:MAG: acyl-CoA dehydrogenase family protein, partial [Sphingomonadaceae bacterium]|nr:acyl-CoA dehydrogenase family protein [Sphingomonadaceae bacterium]
GAGSDVGRLRTVARARADGTWAITGEKMWISFGDHDLTPRIGHCLLARTDRGLSLFLVPSHLPSGDGPEQRNAVVVRRLEEKLGLHGSPTCALGFEEATAWLIGVEGRGLQQLFVMITNMRLSAGVQGLGIAAGAADIAFAYAHERRQGGAPERPPVPIAEHVDIQRELIEMVARVETLRGLGIAIAVHADLAAVETDAQLRDDHSALVQWLLPIFKTTGGEWGFDVASAAIQVLGGAGYKREWPVEQALRDARIATIYEGTSGIQALDLLHRRLWRDRAKGLDVFLATARADLAACPEPGRVQAERCYDFVESAAHHLQAATCEARDAEAGASAFLHLAAIAATGWIATRLAGLGDKSAASRRLAAAGNYWLSNLADRAVPLHAEATRGAAPIDQFHNL